MKNTPEILYTARDTAEFAKLTDQAQPIVEGLAPYLEFLRERYAVTELPRAILSTTRKTATERISDLPLPAYTNEYRIVFCPDVAVWRTLLCSQLNDLTVSSAEIASITSYYHTEYGIPHVRQILGHEFVHQSEYFPGDFDDDADEGCIWFEEGMAEYISRRYFLSPEESVRAGEIGRMLIALRDCSRPRPSIDSFTYNTYADGTMGEVFYWYWRSFFAVESIVNRFHGDVKAVFDELSAWDRSRSMAAARWFGVE